MKILENVKDLLFPQKHICLFCKESCVANGGSICKDCWGLIEFVNNEVKLDLPGLDEVYYSTVYNRFIKEKIHSFKFQGRNYLYKPLGDILLATIGEKDLANKIDSIICVPIHRRKRALRGYNQSELLGRYVSEKLDKPLLNNHLLKSRWTKEQNKLGGLERKENLKDSFKMINVDDLRGKEILLIDDIITTGATMKECSKVLLENGVVKVYGLAVTSSIKL